MWRFMFFPARPRLGGDHSGGKGALWRQNAQSSLRTLCTGNLNDGIGRTVLPRLHSCSCSLAASCEAERGDRVGSHDRFEVVVGVRAA